MTGERHLRGCDNFPLYLKENLCIGRMGSSLSRVKTDHGKCLSQQLWESPTLLKSPPLHRRLLLWLKESERVAMLKLISPVLNRGQRSWTKELFKDTTLLPLPPLPSVPRKARHGGGRQGGPSLVTQEVKHLRSVVRSSHCLIAWRRKWHQLLLVCWWTLSTWNLCLWLGKEANLKRICKLRSESHWRSSGRWSLLWCSGVCLPNCHCKLPSTVQVALRVPAHRLLPWCATPQKSVPEDIVCGPECSSKPPGSYDCGLSLTHANESHGPVSPFLCLPRAFRTMSELPDKVFWGCGPWPPLQLLYNHPPPYMSWPYQTLL